MVSEYVHSVYTAWRGIFQSFCTIVVIVLYNETNRLGLHPLPHVHTRDCDLVRFRFADRRNSFEPEMIVRIII